ARYTGDGGTYDRTVLVKKGAPSALFNASGLFQDKDNIAVDQTTGPHSGNVYVAWSQYTGQAGNNAVQVSRSTAHGLPFSQAVRVPDRVHVLALLQLVRSGGRHLRCPRRLGGEDRERPVEDLRPQLTGRCQLADPRGDDRLGRGRAPVVPRHRLERRHNQRRL